MDDPFDYLPAEAALSVEFEGVDYVFAKQVVGRLKQWLVLTQDPAMMTFGDRIKPGCRMTLRFVHRGTYYSMKAMLKRVVSGDAKAVVIEKPGPVQRVERRAQPRRDCRLSADLELRRKARATVVNINAKGCRIRIPADSDSPPIVEEGDRVHLHVWLPGSNRKVLIIGEVRNRAHDREHFEAGILFEKAPSDLATILASLDGNEKAVTDERIR